MSGGIDGRTYARVCTHACAHVWHAFTSFGRTGGMPDGRTDRRAKDWAGGRASGLDWTGRDETGRDGWMDGRTDGHMFIGTTALPVLNTYLACMSLRHN